MYVHFILDSRFPSVITSEKEEYPVTSLLNNLYIYF